jgi:hypothetical protein
MHDPEGHGMPHGDRTETGRRPVDLQDPRLILAGAAAS